MNDPETGKSEKLNKIKSKFKDVFPGQEFPESNNQKAKGKNIFYIPPIHIEKANDSIRKLQELIHRGRAFHYSDIEDQKNTNQGIISSNRTMAICFCDLKNSTEALLKTEAGKFCKFQSKFLNICEDIIYLKEEGTLFPYASGEHPRSVIYQFLGDGIIFYMDFGNTKKDMKFKTGLKKLLSIIKEISIKMDELSRNIGVENDSEKFCPFPPGKIGLRFGIAFGDEIILSSYGREGMIDPNITGKVVNLASRLEHATPADFIECIRKERNNLARFTTNINSQDVLYGTMIYEKTRLLDQQVIDTYEICENCRFEVRVDARFKDELEEGDKPVNLGWKEISFSPKGFADTTNAYLLGGNNPEDIFTIL